MGYRSEIARSAHDAFDGRVPPLQPVLATAHPVALRQIRAAAVSGSG
jgi:hypothetical protein